MVTVCNVVKLCVSCGMCVDRTARQKHELALEGSYSDVIDCDIEWH